MSNSDSGTFLLDPADRALLSACHEANTKAEAEDEAHRRFLKLARDLPAIRLKKVLKIRRMIADGTFMTEERLQETVDRLLASMRG